MAFSNTRMSISVSVFFFGLSLAGFAVFLHPMDPVDVLVRALMSPAHTAPVMVGYLQSLAFWFSAACIAIGIAGVLAAALQRWQRQQFFSRLDDRRSDGADGEENWMFL